MPTDIEIKFKKHHKDAVKPKHAFESDAGYDLVAIDNGIVTEHYTSTANEDNDILYIEYDTGISIEPPKGYHVEIYPRSSISKTGLMLANSIGLIDYQYRGTLRCRFKVINPKHPRYKKGDKIAQLVVKKTTYATFTEVDELNDTDRGSDGFGSTDCECKGNCNKDVTGKCCGKCCNKCNG